MEVKAIDFGGEMGRGWKLFKENMGLLIIVNLMAGVLGALTCGILTPPLLAGVFMINMRLLKGDAIKPVAGDIFKGFDFFLETIILTAIAVVVALVLSIVPVVGQLLALALGALISWSMMLVVYQRLSAIDALKKIWGLTKEGKFTMPLVFALVASLISGAGVMLCVVGVFFTMPFSVCMLTCCYDTIFSSANSGSEPTKPINDPSDLNDIKPPEMI